jgi:agmatinase
LKIDYLSEKIWSTHPLTDTTFAKFETSIVPKENLRKGDIALIGIPFEGMTFHAVAGRHGPKAIRDNLSYFRTFSAELNLEITDELNISDLGDVSVEPLNYDETFRRINHIVKQVLKQGWIPIFLGGSHTITEATVKAFSEYHDNNIGLIWIDEHPDTMESYLGDTHFCGCPLYRLVSEGYVRGENVAHIGIRGFHNNKVTMGNIRDLGVNVFLMEDVDKYGLVNVVKKAVKKVKEGTKEFYASFDIDAVDAAFAPGTQSPVPGGFLPREMIRTVREVSLAGAAGFDLVEVSPAIDVGYHSITGRLAATLVLEMMAGIAHRARENKQN